MRNNRGFGCLFWIGVTLALVIASMLITDKVWNSDMPMWLKIWLLK